MKRIGRGTAFVFAALAMAASAVSAQELKGLGGERTLQQTGAVPGVERQAAPAGGFGRNYRQQPPLIPHKIDGYQIAVANNACLDCHGGPGQIGAKTPKVPELHYAAREEGHPEKIAGTRYFCLQCHVTQTGAMPLVGNIFQSTVEAK